MIIMTGISAITPAFPELARSLGVSESRVGLLVTVYTLPGIFLAPLLGTFADRHGRKRVLVASLLLFGLAGGACAFVNNFTLLLVLRAVQGIGLAPLFLISLTIIGDLFDGEARTKAMGYNTTVIGLSAAIYPALGGGISAPGPAASFRARVSRAARREGCSFPFLNIPEPKNHPGPQAVFFGRAGERQGPRGYRFARPDRGGSARAGGRLFELCADSARVLSRRFSVSLSAWCWRRAPCPFPLPRRCSVNSPPRCHKSGSSKARLSFPPRRSSSFPSLAPLAPPTGCSCPPWFTVWRTA